MSTFELSVPESTKPQEGQTAPSLRFTRDLPKIVEDIRRPLQTLGRTPCGSYHPRTPSEDTNHPFSDIPCGSFDAVGHFFRGRTHRRNTPPSWNRRGSRRFHRPTKAFVEKLELNEEATNALLEAPVDVQRRVVQEAKVRGTGQGDGVTRDETGTP